MKWIVWIAALCSLALAPRAEVMIPLSIETLASEAALVVHAKVESKTVQRDPAGRIYTRVELTPLATWKGPPPAAPFHLVHGGGVLGEQRVEVTAQVHFKPGTEVVVFLTPNERGEWLCLGMSQGQFHVAQEPGGRRMVWNPFHGQPANPDQEAAAKSPPAAAGLALESLREAVARALSKAKEK